MTASRKLAAYLLPTHLGTSSLSPLDEEACGQLREQGVGPLVYRALSERNLLDVQPAAVRDELARLHRAAVILEPFRRDEVARVLEALTAGGVQALVFKGTALAYTCYPQPWLRPRLDTDLLISRGDLETASRVFERLGCTRTLRPAGEHVTHQSTYVSARHGLNIAFDVHWKVSDPQPFADLFSFEELEREARPVPALSGVAETVGDEHALLVACTHRVAHHYDDDTLIFLYDIDLLARRLTPSGWGRVSTMAAAKRIREVTLRGLDLASNLLGTPVPDHVRAALEADRGSPNAEPSSAYLAPGFRRVDILRADLRELGWRGRARLIREHLFPAPAFILRSYGQPWAGLLPFLYLVRIIRGANAWFRPLR
jgi:hypothetical protein